MSTPKVLGLEMVGSNELCWRLRFGDMRAELLGGYGEGPLSWCALVAEEFVAVHKTKEACISAIERELLAIRNAIPPVCYHCQDVLVSEPDHCERCPAECDGDCDEEECEARAEAIKSAIPDAAEGAP